jgi:GDP-4-dehydro-6-deoxy-D-mannose reductase
VQAGKDAGTGVRIFVTGISGFVGGHLAAALLARGHRVGGSYHGGESGLGGLDRDRVELHAASLEQRGEMAAAVRAFAPERIVHLAGLAHVGESWARMGDYFRVNVLGTEEVLAAAPSVPVVFASSAEVYGAVPAEEQPLGEERTPAPASPYALTKAAAERLVLRSGGIVVRPFNMIGPGQAPCFALAAFARQLAAVARGRQEPVLRVGNLEAQRDFVHVADGADAFALIAERGEAGATYHVASGTALSIRDALDRLIATTGLSPEIALDERFLRPSDVPLLLGSAEPLRRLGWQPRRGIDAALAELWQSTLAQTAAEDAT